MKAAVAEGGRITVRAVAAPEPGPGEALLRVLACGVCGSDLHHFAGRAAGAAPLVYGHEFAAEVLAYGPGASGPAPGTRVVAVPQAGGEIVGLSERYPGGFGERVVVAAAMLIPVPGHVPTDHAALTEPLAVGAHAVAAAPPAPSLVIGCGPIGLAVIAALKSPVRARGQGAAAPATRGEGGDLARGAVASASGDATGGAAPRVIAADLSPGRRALAGRMGADVVVDPAADDPYERLAACLPDAGPPGGSLRSERGAPPAVIFECVGVPGMIQRVFTGAPAGARVVVAGACMEPDTTVPVVALVKELTVAYVFGYTHAEFAATLDAVATGAIDPAPLITGAVGLDGVAGAFADLADPERHAKILVHPAEATP